ncbi:MAG TPA: transcription repressor NadR [Candidatus Acidoferrales bacterium]|nr:transcription repressor NadR [Candidatus Acidoferrales bacterium]
MKAANNSSKGNATSESGEARRRQIVSWLRSHGMPIRGGDLAKHFRVSRQCLVQDMAILRAGGEEIMATPRGYQLPTTNKQVHRAVIACKHGPERTEEELQTLVDHGVKILDVIVEHPIYGELRRALMLESRADVHEFLDHVRSSKATLLSALTGGVHLHTLEASRPDAISRARADLRKRGILLK